MLIKRNKAIMVAAVLYGLMTLVFLSIGNALAEGDKASFESCFIDGISRVVKCMELEVPENWDQPDGKKITLHMAIVPAQGANQSPDPLIVLAGGPGQAASDYGALIPSAFNKINQNRDIILIDQRGTGSSNPLECDFGFGTAGRIPDQEIITALNFCLETFDSDIRFFTSFDIIKDLEFIRKTLGIEKYNIWGGSYGTRLGLLYMKLHPDSIRSAILDGVTAPNSRLFVLAPRAAEDAWLELVSVCLAELECAEAFPSLDQDFRDLLFDLTENPVTIQVKDLWSGATVDVLIDATWLAESVRTALYTPSRAALLPFALSRAKTGDFQSLIALSQDANFWAGDTMAIGSTLAILCSEELPRNPEEEVMAEAKGRFHKDYYFRFWELACQSVPVRDVLEGYEMPVSVEVPTLILSGEIDPVTPPFQGEIAMQGLPNAWHFTARNSGHNVTPTGCAPKLLAIFINQASADNIDSTCLDDSVRPPFLLTPLKYGLKSDSEGDLK